MPAPDQPFSPADGEVDGNSDGEVDGGDALPGVGKVWDSGPKRSLSEIMAAANRQRSAIASRPAAVTAVQGLPAQPAAQPARSGVEAGMAQGVSRAGIPLTPELRAQLEKDPLIRAIMETFNGNIVKVEQSESQKNV